MKSNNKRLLSILLCLAMVLAMLPLAVSAETATTIYVQPNENWLQSDARFAAYFYEGDANIWLDCTDPDGDGNYGVEVPAGYTNVIFCRMNPETTENNWDNKWNQTADLTVPTDDKIVYVVDGWDNGSGQWIEVGGEPEEIEVVYYLRGTMNEWDTSTPLTNNGDGTYSVTVNLAADTYEYKIADAGWGNAYPSGDNAVLVVDSACAVTFVLNTNDGTVTVTGDGIGEPEEVTVEKYVIAGTSNLCGAEWDATATEGNTMTIGAEGIARITYTDVAAGDYEFKVVAILSNGDTAWYGDVATGDNVTFTVEYFAEEVEIEFDPATGDIGVAWSEDEPEVTEPSEEPTEPSEEPTEPSEEPTEPSEEPTEPSEEPTEPSEEPTEPSEEPTEPSEEPTEPSEEPTEPSEEPTEPEDPTEPEEPDEDVPPVVSLWIKWWKFYISAVEKYLSYWK